MIIIYWVIQTAVSMQPIARLQYFFFFKTVIVTPAWLCVQNGLVLNAVDKHTLLRSAMFLWAVIVTKGQGILILGPSTVVGSRAFSALQALNVIIGLFSSLAVNSACYFFFSSFAGSLADARFLPVVRSISLPSFRKLLLIRFSPPARFRSFLQEQGSWNLPSAPGSSISCRVCGTETDLARSFQLLEHSARSLPSSSRRPTCNSTARTSGTSPL